MNKLVKCFVADLPKMVGGRAKGDFGDFQLPAPKLFKACRICGEMS